MKRPLYHFTCLFHWREIDRDGEIRPTEANLVPPDAVETAFRRAGKPNAYRPAGDKRVVWLSDVATATNQPWAMIPTEWLSRVEHPEEWDKTEIRITVDVRAPQWWPAWAREHGMPLWWYRKLDTGHAHSWYIVPRPIPRAEWVRVENTKTGMVLWESKETTRA